MLEGDIGIGSYEAASCRSSPGVLRIAPALQNSLCKIRNQPSLRVLLRHYLGLDRGAITPAMGGRAKGTASSKIRCHHSGKTGHKSSEWHAPPCAKGLRPFRPHFGGMRPNILVSNQGQVWSELASTFRPFWGRPGRMWVGCVWAVAR